MDLATMLRNLKEMDIHQLASAIAFGQLSSALHGSTGGVSSSVHPTVDEGLRRRVIGLVSSYETSRADLLEKERLQQHALSRMLEWEAAGRPGGEGGVLPVFPQYAEPTISYAHAR